MIKAIALDDEPPALKVLTAFCAKVDFIDLQQTFISTQGALDYVIKHEVDLIFIDINMPAISGIDFYKRLPKKPMLILTTAYSEFALEGFNLNAVDYLLKPFLFSRFMQSLEKANHLFKINNEPSKEDKEDFIVLRIDYSLTKLLLSDIVYIEGLDDYLKIHLKQQKPVIARLTMKAMLEKLPSKDFARVHRSYIISLKEVESVRNKVISIFKEEIPIGTSYADDFFARFNTEK